MLKLGKYRGNKKLYNVFYLDITNEELQLYMDVVIGIDNPQRLVTPELFGLELNEDPTEDAEDAEDQTDEAEKTARTSPQY